MCLSERQYVCPCLCAYTCPSLNIAVNAYIPTQSGYSLICLWLLQPGRKQTIRWLIVKYVCSIKAVIKAKVLRKPLHALHLQWGFNSSRKKKKKKKEKRLQHTVILCDTFYRSQSKHNESVSWLDFYTRCYRCLSNLSICKCQIRALHLSLVTTTAISMITRLKKTGDKGHLRRWPYQPCWNTAIKCNWGSRHSSCQSIEGSIVR